jgi:division protein CdvB (Snf7/Vps24/ESCRT-III family)
LVAALIETSSLSGDQIDAIIARVVAMRSIRLEHQRRAEWQRTTESAARSTLDHKTRI